MLFHYLCFLESTVHVYNFAWLSVCLNFCSYANSLEIENTKVLLSPNCALIPVISKDHNLLSPSDRDLKTLQFAKELIRGKLKPGGAYLLLRGPGLAPLL